MNGRYLRELAPDDLRARLEAAARAASCRAAAVEISQEKMQTLADFGPLAGFLLEAPAELRREGLGEGHGRRRRRAPAGGPRGARAGARAVRRRAGRGGAARRASSELGVKPKDVFQPMRVAITRHDGLARASSSRSPRWAATRRSRASTARSSARSDGALSKPQLCGIHLPIARVGRAGPRAPTQRAIHRTRGSSSRSDPARSVPTRVVATHNEGHGRRLTAAFEALEAFPALAESRNRVLRVVRDERTSVGEVVAAVESDVALVITVLRIANRTAAAQARQDRQHPRGRRGPHARRASRRSPPAPPPSTSSSAPRAGT